MRTRINNHLFLGLVLLFLIVILPFSIAEPPFQISQEGIQIETPIIEFLKDNVTYTFNIHAHNQTSGKILTNTTANCFFHLYNSNGSHIIEDTMIFNNNTIDFSYTVLGDNLTTGQYAALFYCNSTDIGGFLEYGFEVNPSGEGFSTSDGLTYLAILIFLISLIGGFYMLHTRIDYESWNNQIIKKYQNKNYIKLVLSSITYNIMKGAFVVYYLIGLLILILITDLAFRSAYLSMIQIMPSILAIYIVGVIIVGFYFFGYIQEWLMGLKEQLEKNSWGLG